MADPKTQRFIARVFVGFGLAVVLVAIPWQIFWGAGFKGRPDQSTWQLLGEACRDPVMGLVIFWPHLLALGFFALAAFFAWRGRRP